MNRCKICNKEFEPSTFIEYMTGCCTDCLRLFTEPDDDDMHRDDFEEIEDKE